LHDSVWFGGDIIDILSSNLLSRRNSDTTHAILQREPSTLSSEARIMESEEEDYKAPVAPWVEFSGKDTDADEDYNSEFPSLSNNPSQNTNPGQSTWAMPTGRPLGQATSHRTQQALLPSQQQTLAQQQTQQQQDDLFASSSQLPSSQGGFRFGGQNPVGQSSQSQENTTDDFPPLSRNVNGDIGQDRLGLLQNVGFGGQSSNLGFGAGIGGSHTNRNNGLLNALSSSSRTPSINPRDTGAVGPTGKSP
jgi:hypothetical protein